MTGSSGVPPLAAGQIEIWKKIVDVQQHFNDLELRIRNFALVVTGALLGLGGYAIKDGGTISAFGFEAATAGLVVLLAIVPLFAFYFMDRLWYHRLLEGSVEAGIEAENALKDLGFIVDLGSKVSAKSPFNLWLFGLKVRSKHKMDIFYLTLVVALVLVGSCLAFGAHRPQEAASRPTSKHSSTPVAPRVSSTTESAEPTSNPASSADRIGNSSERGAADTALKSSSALSQRKSVGNMTPKITTNSNSKPKLDSSGGSVIEVATEPESNQGR